MQLTADIYDAAGVKQGEGPVWALTGATFTRALDGAGSLNVSSPGSEARAIQLLTNERRLRVYGYVSETRRELGRGIIRDVRAQANASGWTLTADGPDMLDELKRRSVWLAKIYSTQTLGQIVRDLAGLAGWTVSVDAAYRDKLMNARFDGVSVLKALQEIAKGQGLHLREGADEKTVEMGAFGQASGVRLIGVGSVPIELLSNDDVMLIDSITITRASEHIVNWLIPVGAGEGESAITLAKSTRTSPYPIRPVAANGKTFYALVDEASVAAYGRIEKVGAFKDVSPISNSDADLEMAANALYDVAAAWLARNSQRIDTCRVSVVKVRRTVRPGDTVRLVYKGLIETETGLLTFMDVDADFYVIRVTERIGLEGTALDLEISNVDQVAQDAAQIIVAAIDQITMSGLRVQPYPSGGTFPYGYAIDPTHSIKIPVEITSRVLYLNQCRLYVRSMPFRVLAKAAATGEVTTSSGGGSTQTSSAGGSSTQTSSGGGNHNHRMLLLTSVTGFPATSPRPYWARDNSGGSFIGFKVETAFDSDIWTEGASGDHAHDISIPAHTHAITIPPHSHTVPSLLIDYGINDDTQYPSGIRISVDGVDVTEELGGPWGVGAAEINTTLDITDYIVNSARGLKGPHEVEFTCTGGQGWIETTVELGTTVQSIDVQ